MAQYIFVIGGVLSSLGKGIATASIGLLLKSMGYRVATQKFDPYLNVDPGTMSPFQHGEVFVTDDGAETDLDLGHYERFVDEALTRHSSCSAGQIYEGVLQNERKGIYKGKTVQVIPHVTDEIKRRIQKLDADYDIIITEIGGTVGDIESLPFLEAIRQFRNEVGRQNAIFIHLTWVPFIKTAGEVKTKPTQHSVKALREIGIQPDILLCRTENFLSDEIKGKIALFCNVEVNCVFTAKDVGCIYECPLVYHREGLDAKIIELLNMWTGQPKLTAWENVVEKFYHPAHEVCIGIAGKYVNLTDSYKSLNEALVHGGIANNCRVKLKFVDTEKIEQDGAASHLSDVDGVLVPGGFGNRGIEGMILSARYARENQIPYFGICLGMQMAVIEYARDICGLAGANSSEFDPACPHPVIDLLPQQRTVRDKGASMRLGAWPCAIAESSFAFEAYGQKEISERHRHRYEFNNDFKKMLTEKGLRITGASPDGTLAEIIEISDHPWFLGCQFHPEFKSRPTSPHPLFSKFIEAALKQSGT